MNATTTLLLVFSVLLSSCNQLHFTDKKSETLNQPQQQAIDPTAGEIVTATFFDKNNAAVRMIFDNTKNTATIYTSADTIELEGQRTSSGIWYKNDHYDLRGKGANVELTRDGETIFKNEQ